MTSIFFFKKDFPCGDQQWAPYLRKLNPDLKYIGVDIVPSVIQRNIDVFQKDREADRKHPLEFFLLDMREPDGYKKIKEHSKIWKDDDIVLIHQRHAWQHNVIEGVLDIIQKIRFLIFFFS